MSFPFLSGGFSTLLTGLRTMTLVSDEETRTIPVGIQAGDLIVFGAWTTNPPASYSPGQGLAEYFKVNGGFQIVSITIWLFMKVATGNEGGNTLDEIPEGSGETTPTNAYRLMTFRGDRPLTSISSRLGYNAQQTTGNPSSQVKNIQNEEDPVMVVAMWNRLQGAVANRIMTPSKTGETTIGSGGHTYVGWKVVFNNPENVTVDMNDEGSNSLASYYVRLNT